MKIIRVGVDLAKEVFHVHGVSRKEEPVWRRKLSREAEGGDGEIGAGR